MIIDSEYLDLAIALAVVFFLASLVVSGLNEGLQLITRVRAKFLWAYLYELTVLPADQAKKRLPRGFFRTISFWWTSRRAANDPRPIVVPGTNPARQAEPPQLETLARSLGPIDAPGITGRRKGKRTTIKHIPVRSLAAGFIDLFAETGQAAVVAAVAEYGESGGEAEDAQAFGRRLADLAGADRASRDAAADAAADLFSATEDAARLAGATALADALGGRPDVIAAAVATYRSAIAEAEGEQRAEIAGALAEVLRHECLGRSARGVVDEAVATFGETPIGPTLERLWAQAAGDVERFRTGLEGWFDAEMQRLGGFYKRSVRWILAILALLVAAALNIDSIGLARDLWDNPEGRAALVARAEAVTPAGSDGGDATVVPVLEQLRLACQSGETEPIETVEAAREQVEAVRACVTGAVDELTELDLTNNSILQGWDAWRDAWRAGDGADRALHAAGVVLMWLALLVGAPFWFDLIKRLTGVRRGLVGDT